MATKQQFLTSEGRAQLEAELKNLIDVKRPLLAAQLREAIEAGDISESAAYEDAKHQQGMLEGRIIELQKILRIAQTIEEHPDDATHGIMLGSRVTIVSEDGTEEQYKLVGSAEARAREGRISHESPMGRALMGRKVGDKIEVNAPSGTLRFSIKEIGS